MPNYNEIDVNSTSYQRAKSVHITNEYGQDSFISFSEEIIVELPDNKAAHQELGILSGPFTEANASEEVAILDATTGLPTASTITYAEIRNVIRSLYIHMAAKRDATLAQLEADRLAAIAAIDTAVATALANALAAQATAETALADTNSAVSANDPVAALAAANAASTAAATATSEANIANLEAAKPLASATAKSNAIDTALAAGFAQTAANDAQTAAASIQV